MYRLFFSSLMTASTVPRGGVSWGTMSLRLNECVAPLHGCMGSSPEIAPLAGFPSSCKKSDAVLRELRRKYLLRGSIVLTHCVLPPVHIGQDLVYSGITKISPKRKFSAGHPCGHPAKNFGQALQILEKQAFWHGHAARTSTKKLRSEKLWADFSFPNISESL